MHVHRRGRSLPGGVPRMPDSAHSHGGCGEQTEAKEQYTW